MKDLINLLTNSLLKDKEIVSLTPTNEIEILSPSSIYGITTDGEKIDFELDKDLKLKVSYKNLKTLIVKDKRIKRLHCGNNNLTSLDVSKLTNLEELFCSFNNLTSLDISKCTNLKRLGCSNNNLTSLDVSKCTNLEGLYCSDNHLTSLDISGLTNLEYFDCDNNNLTSLDVSKLNNLKELRAGSDVKIIRDNVNEIEILSPSSIYGITTDGEKIDFELDKNLILSVIDKNLQKLIIKDKRIKYLHCSFNNLTSLDVSKCTNLKELVCSNNKLTSLDVSKLTNLKFLNCFNNNLTSLNVSGCTNLEYLYCSDNHLTSLDVSGLTNLEDFDTDENVKIIRDNLNEIEILPPGKVTLSQLENLHSRIKASKDYKEQASLAIQCAEKVLFIFEKEYPEDKRPRRVLEAAKAYLANPTEETEKDIIYAANKILYLTQFEISLVRASLAADSAAFAAFASIGDDYQVENTARQAIKALKIYNKENNKLNEMEILPPSLFHPGETILYGSEGELKLSTDVNRFHKTDEDGNERYLIDDPKTGQRFYALKSSIKKIKPKEELNEMEIVAPQPSPEKPFSKEEVQNLFKQIHEIFGNRLKDYNEFSVYKKPNMSMDEYYKIYGGKPKVITHGTLYGDAISFSMFIENVNEEDKKILQKLIDNFTKGHAFKGVKNINISPNKPWENQFSSNTNIGIYLKNTSSSGGALEEMEILPPQDHNKIWQECFDNAKKEARYQQEIGGEPIDMEDVHYVANKCFKEKTGIDLNTLELDEMEILSPSLIYGIIINGEKIEFELDKDLTLNVTGENLKTLVVKDKRIKKLYCGLNSLTSLDVSKCTNLVHLHCYYNNLTSLDVSGLTNLEVLYCSDNNLTSLDVSRLTNLKGLSCTDNNLTSLDVRGLNNLEELKSDENVKIIRDNLNEMEILPPNKKGSIPSKYYIPEISDLIKSALPIMKHNNYDYISFVYGLNWVSSYRKKDNNNLAQYSLIDRDLQQFLYEIGYHLHQLDPSIGKFILDKYGKVWTGDKYNQVIYEKIPINEIEVLQPGFNFNNLKTVVGISKIPTDFFSADYYMELVDLGTYYTFLPTGDQPFVVLVPKQYIELTDKTGDFKEITQEGMNQIKDLISQNKIYKATPVNLNEMEIRLPRKHWNLTKHISNFDPTDIQVGDKITINPKRKYTSSSNTETFSFTVDSIERVDENGFLDPNGEFYYFNFKKENSPETYSYTSNQLIWFNQNNLNEIEILSPSSIYGITTDGEKINFELDKNLKLDVSNKDLKKLIVKDKQIKELYCYFNHLTSLDVSKCTNLEYFDCDNNNLTSLDVSKLTNLKELFCSFNNLTSLDVSKLTNLKMLGCSNNNLTSLNVSGCTNLASLSCNDNKLTSLDISGLTNLEVLYCDNNHLTSLDVSGLTNLRDFDTDENVKIIRDDVNEMEILPPGFKYQEIWDNCYEQAEDEIGESNEDDEENYYLENEDEVFELAKTLFQAKTGRNFDSIKDIYNLNEMEIITPGDKKYNLNPEFEEWIDSDWEDIRYNFEEDTADAVWMFNMASPDNKTLRKSDVNTFLKKHKDMWDGDTDSLIEFLLDYRVIIPLDSQITENKISKPTNLKDAIKSLTEYMVSQGMNIKPLPKLIMIDDDSENANDILGKTAYYNPSDCSIIVYTLNRHPKDVLRSYAHEIVHRMQDNEGRLNNVNTNNTNEDGELLDLEKEAYEKGNIMLRNWEDLIKNQ